MPVIALISDIHANLAALEAVLAAIDDAGIRTIVCCGDVVGYGPFPAECVRLLRRRAIPSVLGNHDLYTINARHNPHFLPNDERVSENPVWAGIRHAAETLDDDDLDWLVSLPAQRVIAGASVAHASLHNTADWPYLRDASSALPTLKVLELRPHPVGFFGHTHRQQCFALPADAVPVPPATGPFTLPPATPCAVIVGSVGQPRTGDARAAWTTWTATRRTVEFHRTDYDVEATIDAITAGGLPRFSATRLLEGR